MKLSTVSLVFVSVATCALAKDIYIQVGANTTNDATTIFAPSSVTAKLGDTVWFNFTQGNHTAIESLFAHPCTPAHDADITQNGFNSGFQVVAANGTAPTTHPVPITEAIKEKTMWFFDWNTCGEGGVGVINVNDSSTETLEGFQRNAIRLNGTGATQSSSSGASSTATTATGTESSTTTSTTTPNAAVNQAVNMAVSLTSLLLLLAAFTS